MSSATVTESMPATTAVCVHHWLVRSPQGATSWGECRKCGLRRRFSNHFDGRDRANNSDLFGEGSHTWKPDRRSTYHGPSAAAGL